MKFLKKVPQNTCLKASFSLFSLTAIIVTIIIQYTETDFFKVIVPQKDLETYSPLQDEKESVSKKNHYVFVVDISESFKDVSLNDRIKKKCNNVIKILSEKDKINISDYPLPEKSIDAAKLYVLDALLKLEGKSSQTNNVFSVRTVGDDHRKIFPKEPKNTDINIENTMNLIQLFCSNNALGLSNKREWTDFIKLLDHLKKLNSEGEQLIVSIISDFNYSIPGLKKDLSYHKIKIKEKLQELSYLSININMVELAKKDNTNDGIYIAEEHFVEEYFGWKRTGHSIIDLTFNGNSLVSDFIYPIEENNSPLVFKYNYANNIMKSELLLELPKGEYSLSMPFEPPILKLYPKIEIECIESTKNGGERKEKGKIRQGQGAFEFEIDNGECVKLKYKGRVPREIVPTVVRLVDRDRGKSYLIPLKFEKTIPFYIQVFIVLLIVLTIVSLALGVFSLFFKKETNCIKKYEYTDEKNNI